MEKSRSSWNKTTTKTFLFAEYAVILFNKQKVVKQGVPHRRHQQSHANNVKVEHTKTYSCRNIRSRLINHDSCSCRLCSLYFWFEGNKIKGVPKRSFFSVRTPCIKLKSCWHLPANNISLWWFFRSFVKRTASMKLILQILQPPECCLWRNKRNQREIFVVRIISKWTDFS